MNSKRLFHCALALLALASTRASVAQEELFVTNSNSNSVTVYSRTASGNTAPIRILAGPATGLAGPSGILVDTVNEELVVANLALPYSVTVYPRTASGNVAPLRTITGAGTMLDGPRGVAVDVQNNELIVANRAGFSITVYARTANGNAGPIRTIGGNQTGLSNPWGVVLDPYNGEFVVANNGGSMTVYARTAFGNLPPLRITTGSETGFNNGPIGILFDIIYSELTVTTPFYGGEFRPAVLVFPRLTNGNSTPIRSIVGAGTGLSGPNGLAWDFFNDDLYVANSLNNSVTVYAREANGNAAPKRTLSGAATLLNNPQFVAVTGAFLSVLFASSFE